MNIEMIIDELKFIDESAQIRCSVQVAGIESRIYVVGQVQPDTPGVVLGEREPNLRDKNVGTFIKELKAFGDEFQGNDFLFESSYDLNDKSYELRYYKLTHVEVSAGGVVLASTLDELVELREYHQEPELE